MERKQEQRPTEEAAKKGQGVTAGEEFPPEQASEEAEQTEK